MASTRPKTGEPTSKQSNTAWISSFKHAFHGEYNPQYAITPKQAMPLAQSAPLLAEQAVPGPGAAQPTRSETDNDSGPGDSEEQPYKPLWNRAAEELGDKSKYEAGLALTPSQLKRLETYLEDRQKDESFAKDIKNGLDERHGKVLTKDGVSESRWRSLVRHTAKYILASRGLVMGLAALDPHGVATLVFGGVFCMVQIVQGGLEQSQEAVAVTLEIAEVIMLWTCVEERQIKTNRNPKLKDHYARLADEIVEMYKCVVCLLGKVLPYFDNKWRQFFDVFKPGKDEWMNLNKRMKSREAICNRIKEEISIVKTDQEQTSAALKWISSHDFRAAYKGVQERTQIETLHKDRGYWLIEDTRFQSWDTPGKRGVLWLRGTIGTGKTTLMARAIDQISSTGKTDANIPAIYFFDKVRRSSETSAETCFRSLTRQLSYSYATSRIESAADGVYQDLKDTQNADSLQTGECLKLLKTVLSGKDAYIMIDAIDECANPKELLRSLAQLTRSLDQGALHIMLCSRMKPSVLDYFELDDPSIITTRGATSLEDQEFYVDAEIDARQQDSPGALFFKSPRGFPDRLKTILKRKGQGLFRWIEIQIVTFTQGDWNTEPEIERKLKRIDELTLDPDLDDILSVEYKHLLEDLGRDKVNQELAVKILQFVACSFWPLSVISLTEAINASQAETGDDELSADDVARLLAGFVIETHTQPEYRRFRHVQGSIALQLAHTSVLEYLMDHNTHKAAKGRFTIPALHSAVTQICIACISHQLQLGWEDILAAEALSTGTVYDLQAYRVGMSDMFYYSCMEWLQHCRIAFADSEEPELTLRIRKFILSDSWSTWNRAVRGLLTRDKDPRYYPRYRGHVINDIGVYGSTQARPDFAIAACNMMALVEDPEIQRLVDLRHLNTKGQDLFYVSLLWSKREIILRLLQLQSQPPLWRNDSSTLATAISRYMPEAVKRLLQSYQAGPRNSPSDGKAITMALDQTLRLIYYGYPQLHSNESVSEYSDSMAEIIRLLLSNGANLFAADSQGRGMMHFASERFAQEILIDHARCLEEKGLRGSVQRLLRIRDISGETPIEVAMPDSAIYLENELSQAWLRDGEVMYDFENIDIEALRTGVVSKETLLGYLRQRRGRVDRDMDIRIEYAYREYRRWLAGRCLELKEQYSSEQRKLALESTAGASELALPDEWDCTEQRVQESHWSTIIEV